VKGKRHGNKVVAVLRRDPVFIAAGGSPRGLRPVGAGGPRNASRGDVRTPPRPGFRQSPPPQCRGGASLREPVILKGATWTPGCVIRCLAPLGGRSAAVHAANVFVYRRPTGIVSAHQIITPATRTWSRTERHPISLPQPGQDGKRPLTPKTKGVRAHSPPGCAGSRGSPARRRGRRGGANHKVTSTAAAKRQ